MHRLGEMSDNQRIRTGTLLLVAGTVLMVLAVIVVHQAGLPAEEVDPDSFFSFIPQNIWLKGFGYLMSFGASQLMILGAAFIWVLNQKMTWARATFAAFLAWMEMVWIFGIVPSEWLNFSQTDLDWSFQRAWFEIPPWLLLGNEVTFSYGALKDAISGTYNMIMLVLGGIFAYKVQDIGKPRPAAAAPEEKLSPYGRPLVKGDR